MDVTALVVAGLAFLGVLTAAFFSFVPNISVRAQAIREAELLAKLRELKMTDEAEAVQGLLSRRIDRWSSRLARFLTVVFNALVVVGITSFLILALLLLTQANRLIAATGTVSWSGMETPLISVLASVTVTAVALAWGCIALLARRA